MRKTEARWIEAKQHWRIDVQQNCERRSFYSSTRGRKGKIECERKADDWLEDNNDILSNLAWIRYTQTILKRYIVPEAKPLT